MPNINAWLGITANNAPQVADRASDAWRRIQDKPVTVAVWRNGSFHHNEVVRMEWDNQTNNMAGDGNAVTIATIVVFFGVSGHPDDTITDTDIVEGDEIALSGQIYQVKDVLLTIGELQARTVRLT